jgi:hypothetical protein
MMAAATFGQMWYNMIRQGGEPVTRAAATNSCSRTESVCPRTRRAKCGVKPIPMASNVIFQARPQTIGDGQCQQQLEEGEKAIDQPNENVVLFPCD